MSLGAWGRNSRDRSGWEQGKYFIAWGRPHPLPLPREVVYRGASGTGREGSVAWVSAPGQMGMGSPAQCTSVIILQRQILGVSEPRRSRSCLEHHPSALVGSSPCSLAWVLTMNFLLQLCGGTWRLALAIRDRIRTEGVAWTREEAAY